MAFLILVGELERKTQWVNLNNKVHLNIKIYEIVKRKKKEKKTKMEFKMN